MHDLNSLELTFSEVISGYYIKVKEVVQHDSGKLFATPFINDGLFRVIIFNQNFITDEGSSYSESIANENDDEVPISNADELIQGRPQHRF